MVHMRNLAAATAALVATAAAEDVLFSRRSLEKRQESPELYNVSFFHINDVHAHLDEFRSSGTDCDNPARGCYGGYARIKTIVDDIRPGTENSLFLDAGDEFQGTMFYNYYKGEKIAETINQLGFDGMTLGNHEFDGGDDQLGAFLENLTFPIISANIQSDNPILNRTIVPYHIYEDLGIAVIGVTTPETRGISSPGEGTTFGNVVEAVQRCVDEIRSTTNITRIAALTHIGYEEDQQLAESTTGLYLIMGGHSHTPLGDFEGAEGPYPTIVNNTDGEEVFIVTAYRWGEYLGYIDVLYDAEGKVVEYHGAPIHVTNSTAQDEDLQTQIDAWREPFEAFSAQEVGTTNVVLDQTTCQQMECTLGDFMADAMLAYRKNLTDEVDFAIINAGGIRATIDEGTITRGEVLTSFPFGNSIVEITMTGQQIWDVLEGIVSEVNVENGEEVTSFFQVSRGIRVEYNPNAANGSKLVSVDIGDPDLAPIEPEEEYNLVTLDFLAGGGDNFFTPTTDFVSLDTQDEVLVQYIQAQSPVNIELSRRIVESDGAPGSPGNSSSVGSANSTEGANGTDSSSDSGSGNAASQATAGLGAVAFAAMVALAVAAF
ncbi:5'-nucleotidase [Cyphellophora attinorum]|uniref:apyrase n=1 Tax=Cyphellophora attinorum TaxID=1664694 RepID=A0A0N1P0A5_9EURO|nr:5'-nucleotidase [Phialophora attinorum]KPI42386.1 5'-nucleotidase [Phialophora attinorum]